MNTGNQIVDEITQIKFEGNIIPNSWYCHIKRTPDTIKKKNKRKTPEYRTDILAINILSDIIYWYRASETRDENSGKTISYKKKFKADKYQKWYSSWMDMFGVTKRQIQLAIKTLIDLQLLERDVRNITTEQGLKLTGVTYFSPIPENIKYINIPISDNHPPIYHVMTPLQNSKGGVTKLQGGDDKIVIHTETPTKNTPETTTDTVGKNSGKGKTSSKGNPVQENSVDDASHPVQSSVDDSVDSIPYSVSRRESQILIDFIDNSKNKEFRCVKLCETLLNRSEDMEFPAQDNIGNVDKFKDKVFRHNRSYDKGEIQGAIELFDALPAESIHRQRMKEYIAHEKQKWDFSKTKYKQSVLAQFILEYILWHPVYAHFKAVKEKGLLAQDIANYAKRNRKSKSKEKPEEYWEVEPNHFGEETTA